MRPSTPGFGSPIYMHYLEDKREKQRIFRLNELYREDVSQRFSSFLSRIGLPPIYRCEKCNNYENNSEKGDSNQNIPPFTEPKQFHPTWKCPTCGASKSQLKPI